jgi:imidazolonepropionase-like amidohydrolase
VAAWPWVEEAETRLKAQSEAQKQALEQLRQKANGLTPAQALTAVTKTAAGALDLDEHIGTVTAGKLADLTIVDGDPLAEPHLLSDPGRIWLVLQQGVPVAGQVLANPAGPDGWQDEA